MQTVKIPEPCHENWNEMTPTQKGAFCGKCAIDVVDFSKMSNDEVKLTLLEKKGEHLCGRFGNDQLDTFNLEEQWAKSSSWKVYLSKFVAALVLGFGMTLFNGLHAQAENDIRYKTLGMYIMVEEPDTIAIEEVTIQADTVAENVCEKDVVAQHRKGKVKVEPTETFTRGNIIVEEVEEPVDTSKVEAVPVEEIEIHTKGEVAIEFIQGDIEVQYIEEELETVEVNSIDSAKVEEIKNIAEPKETFTPRYRIGTRGTETTPKPLKSYELETSPMPIPNQQFTSKIFPNPSKTVSALVITNEVAQNFDIVLFSGEGKVVNEIFAGEIHAGEARFSIDLSSLGTGVYYVQIITSKGTETIKLQKVD